VWNLVNCVGEVGLESRTGFGLNFSTRAANNAAVAETGKWLLLTFRELSAGQELTALRSANPERSAQGISLHED
jgi:hypothetical protein